MPRHPQVDRSAGARRIRLEGRVQGLGVRPAIARLAGELALRGSVANGQHGVEIVVEGQPAALGEFSRRLRESLPAGASVTGVMADDVSPSGAMDFSIARSPEGEPPGVEMPRDVAVCEGCLAEIADPTNRRAAYPFTSCTRCGPRYSVIDRLPYERERTTMAAFDLCGACRAEYQSPADRRFHAETIACAACGPRAWCTDRAGRQLAGGASAIEATVRALAAGQIVALRGLGGYQLLCDAGNAATVERLRAGKRRPAKPLAVMVESLSAAERVARLGALDRAHLAAAENPIVIVPARAEARLAAGVHPGLSDVGLMLPTTPLHWLIASRAAAPLVATSGNREGEPLAVEVAAAQDTLADVADLWLHHDRPIRQPIDDAVVRAVAGRMVTLRCARGLAPLPLALRSGRAALAVGGHQKSAVALSNTLQCVLGPHLGDLDHAAARNRWLAHVERLVQLYGAAPELIVHDLHPDYFTTRWAEDRPGRRLAVQHHHAHIVSGMVEQSWLDREVLGVAMDGTGFGPDGTIWGGEFLRATVQRFERVAHLRPLPLAGGETAVRQPWRVAVALVAEAAGPDAAARLKFADQEPRAPAQLLPLLGGRLAVRTTSAGRLFDGVAALILGRGRAEFEGHLAMLLEYACDPSAGGAYPLPLDDRLRPWQLDWRPLVQALCADRAAGVDPAAMAMKFHRGLAAAIRRVARRFESLPVVLGGGVFQNRVLVELLAEEDFGSQPLGLPGAIPPNDGGLAAGQLAMALARERAA